MKMIGSLVLGVMISVIGTAALADPATHILSFEKLVTYSKTDCGRNGAGKIICVPACRIASRLKKVNRTYSSEQLSVQMSFYDPLGRTDERRITRTIEFDLTSNANKKQTWVEGLRCSDLNLKKLTASCIGSSWNSRCGGFYKIKLVGYPKIFHKNGQFLFTD